jgi:3-dehydroquinate dehydratase-2
MKCTIGLLNGPNLHRLGEREPHVYGQQTLNAIEAQLTAQAAAAGIELLSSQSNHEGALIDTLWSWHDEGIAGIIFNPGGFSHTSLVLYDAIAAIRPPVIEVHLSHIHNREIFRHELLTAKACKGLICGLGSMSYRLALEAFIQMHLNGPICDTQGVK